MGIPQIPLLPFGLKVHARRRTRTGYSAQWEARTEAGIYVGPAPHTPGGHLVWIPEKDGEPGRILLTNTVYPLRGQSATCVKPKYRLRDKRSPPFALRAVAAVEATGHVWSLPSRWAGGAPGGECLHDGSNPVNSKNEDDGSDFGNDPGDSEGLGVELSEYGSGSGLVEDSIEGLSWVSCRDAGPEDVGRPCRGGAEWSRESEAEGTFLDSVPSSLKTLDGELKLWIQSCAEAGVFSSQECLEVLDQGLKGIPVARRSLVQGQGRAVLLGLYGLGGFRGISRATIGNPEVTRYLNGFVRNQCPTHLWTALYVSRNTVMPVHRDLRNAKGFDVLVRAVGDFVGGGLWVESEDGTGPVCKEVPTGKLCPGLVYDIKNYPAVFSGDRWHAPELWSGESRWVIAAFVPRDITSTSEEQWRTLRDLGFPVDGVLARREELKIRSEGSLEKIDVTKSDFFEGSWEVALPSPFWEHVHEGWDHTHQCAAKLRRFLTAELCEAVDREEDLKETAGQLRQAEIVCDWLEQGLVNWDEGILVGALQVEVPIGSEGTSDQFLQTRTVGLAEARKELPKWVEPAREEVTSLEATNRAVDRVKASDVDAWANEGVNIVQLPGKVVLTRKSGTGKRRCRAVCCGNYLPTEKLGLTREDLYASGAEALSDKLALIFAARFPLWVGIIVDVKSAFLYAPIRSDYEGAEERIIVKPPGFLVELGLLDREDRWWIRKALYGLPTSPRDWGRYRDQEFKKFVITSEGVTHHLVQTKSDDALWLARVFKDGCLGDVAGILIVYVDDLAFLGPPELCKQFVAAIRANWKTSEPEWIGKVPGTFCGIELSRGDTGYRMTQRSYIQELLNRYGVEEEAGVPITKWVEPEHPEAATVDQVRDAQGITGALLWLSTRTRPDLAYVVARCGQQATKSPCLSMAMGRQALSYLKSTLDMGIDVPFKVADTFSDHSLLPLPRADRVLELFTDASHSPNGDRSMQAVFIVWRGVPVAWESTRQAFTTLSSAESELVCMVHGLQLAEAVQPLVDELVEQDSLISLLADNEAAIRAFEASPAGWRNRHLRMRAHAGRERIAANVRKVSH